MAVTVANLAQQTSSNTGLPIGEDRAQKTFKIYFTFTLTGVYVAGGFVLDLTQLFTATAGGPGASLTTPAVPLKVELQSAHSTTNPQTNLYFYNYAPGTTPANGQGQIFTGAAAQTGLTELSAGALPAGVTGDIIQGEATCRRSRMATLREVQAGYVNREHIKDPYLKGSLDDIVSQVAAVMRQGNFTAEGSPSPPSSPAGVSVSANNGLVTATINHPDAPDGTQWVLYYSTSPTFANPIKLTLSHPVWQQYIPQQTIYFKVTAKFQASAESTPTYFGTSVSPTAVATGVTQSSS